MPRRIKDNEKIQLQFNSMSHEFVDRYLEDHYMQTFRKYPYTEKAHLFTLPKEIQEVITMNFFN